ncbi:amidohydrolase family protein [Propionibacterium sp.]|uniref:amidohydrolase family protein n=1 Tax=Propionibacterium sp. TaxID=1977903 RepID=UPI0039E9872D
MTTAGGPWRLQGVLLPSGEDTELWIEHGVLVDGPLPTATTLRHGCWIMPGFVDAHCHIGLGAKGAVPMDTAREQARTDRDAGTLLVRDAGVPIDTHAMDDEPDMPRIIRAGRHIARPRRYLRGYGVEIEPEQLVDEVDRQARRGDGWVKLVGDWIDRDKGDLAPLWEPAIAEQAIERAHSLGARVTAHCFGEDSATELVGAGIDCIEHGTGISPQTVDEMARRQVALVPTLINIQTFPAIADSAQRFPTYAAHMRALFAGHLPRLRAARDAGVPIYAGTDAGGTIHHGRIGDEIVALGQLGDAEFALGAASWRARRWLGAPGPEDGAPAKGSGVEVGASADLVVFDSDPRLDLSVCTHPDLVVLRGNPIIG